MIIIMIIIRLISIVIIITNDINRRLPRHCGLLLDR